MNFNSIKNSISKNSIKGLISKGAVKSIFLGLLLLFFVFIVGSYFFNFSTEGMKEGADDKDTDPTKDAVDSTAVLLKDLSGLSTVKSSDKSKKLSNISDDFDDLTKKMKKVLVDKKVSE